MNLMIKNMMKVWMLGKITIKFKIDLINCYNIKLFKYK